MAIDLVKNIISGKGVPRLGAPWVDGKGAPRLGAPRLDGKGAPRLGAYMPQIPPPFIGNWPNGQIGRGKKKTSNKRTGSNSSKKQSVQLNSTNRRHLVKPKLHKRIAMTNFDLLKWCKYLKIPINGVLSTDQKVPHNHEEALFIYNLYPSYMFGSHWVTTFIKVNVINYFDSFEMPPFQELVNHAKKKFNPSTSRQSN